LICNLRTRQSKNSYEFSCHRNTEFFNSIDRLLPFKMGEISRAERPLLVKAAIRHLHHRQGNLSRFGWEFQMNWDATTAIGEMLGAIAVIVTLAFSAVLNR
jgi:hypothetical protein